MQNPIQSLTSPLASSAEARPAPAAVPVPWIERLFDRLRVILGPRLADLFAGAPVEDVKREWGEALAGFTGEEIKRGLDETRTRRFPPSLPEFLHLCRPGLDPEVAWYEAEQGLRAHAEKRAFPWSHPAIYWAARDSTFAPAIRGESFSKHRKRWEIHLKAEFAKGAWANPPDPTQRRIAAAPAVVDDPVGRDEAKRLMANLRDKLARRARSASTTDQPEETA